MGQRARSEFFALQVLENPLLTLLAVAGPDLRGVVFTAGRRTAEALHRTKENGGEGNDHWDMELQNKSGRFQSKVLRF